MKKIDNITTDIRDLMLNRAVGMLSDPTDDDIGELLYIIASLHNELYKAVPGESYNYMYHWFNLGCGGSIEDDKYKGVTNIELFKREAKE